MYCTPQQRSQQRALCIPDNCVWCVVCVCVWGGEGGTAAEQQSRGSTHSWPLHVSNDSSRGGAMAHGGRRRHLKYEARIGFTVAEVLPPLVAAADMTSIRTSKYRHVFANDPKADSVFTLFRLNSSCKSRAPQPINKCCAIFAPLSRCSPTFPCFTMLVLNALIDYVRRFRV